MSTTDLSSPVSARSALVTKEEWRLLLFYSNMVDGDHLRAEELEAFRNIREILLKVTRQLKAGDLDSSMMLHFRLDWLHSLMMQYFAAYEINKEILYLTGTAHDSIAINTAQLAECPPPQRIFLGD